MFSLFQFLNLQLAPVSHLSIPACMLTASCWCSCKDPLTANDGFIYLCPFNYHNWAPLACTAFTYAWKWLMETVGSVFLVKLWWDNDYMLVRLLDRINLLRVTVSVVPHADFMPCWWIISCAFYFFFFFCPLMGLVAMAMRVGERWRVKERKVCLQSSISLSGNSCACSSSHPQVDTIVVREWSAAHLFPFFITHLCCGAKM